MKKNNNAITLVSLIITIVIMLILAGVAINLIIGKNGLFNKVVAARDINEKASVEEEIKDILAEYPIDKEDSGISFDDFLNEKVELKDIDSFKKKSDDIYIVYKKGYSITVNYPDLTIEDIKKTDDTSKGNGNTEESSSISREGIKVGDYVDYVPAIADPYVVKGSEVGCKIDDNYDDTKDYYDKTVYQDLDVKWRVFKIYSDGKIDLIPERVVFQNADRVELSFSGCLGYNNGVTILNDLCDKLYSNGTIKARSININDIENQMTTDGIAKRDSFVNSNSYGNIQYGTRKVYTYYGASYPRLYSQEIGSGINTDTERTDGLNPSDNAEKDITTPGYVSNKDETSKLIVKQTAYSADLRNVCIAPVNEILDTDYDYFIATRYINCYSTYGANFGMFYASDGILKCSDHLFYSNNTSGAGIMYGGFKPIVQIGTDIHITPCEGTNSSTNMHKIVK